MGWGCSHHAGLSLWPCPRASPTPKVNSSIPGKISTTFSFKEADMTPGDKLLLFSQNELRRCKSQSQGMAQKKC